MRPEQTQQFAELFVRHQRRIYGFILTVVPHTADADEIFQETSLVLWRKAGDFDPAASGSDFARWANAVALNVVRNWRTKRARDRHRFSDALMQSIADRQAERGEELDHRLGALSRCMDKLPGADRELLTACYGGDASIAQIAEDLRQKPNALYQRLHRIRRGLLGCIERTLGPAPDSPSSAPAGGAA